jgi:thiol-disulfide isomerase/thioredoxin
MKYLSCLLALLASASLLTAGDSLKPGQPLPKLAPLLNGAKTPDTAGKVVLVDFWASWCGPCRHSFPWLNDMATKYADQGFEVLGVNLDTEADEAARFLAKLPARFPVVYDPEGVTPALYNVKGMPTSVLIGRDGTVRYQHIGFTQQSREGLEAAIKQALETQP